MRLRWLENRIREDGEFILFFIGSLILVLVAVVVDVEAEALLLRILPIDARLCVALMIGWICILMSRVLLVSTTSFVD